MAAAGSGRPKARTRGPSPEKTARTREAIVQAAIKEFLSRGFAASTMAGVAKRAGVAKGTPYIYFSTKEDLFAGMVRDVITNPLEEAESEALLPDEPIGTYLRRTLLPVMQNLEATGRAGLARLVISEGAKFPFLAETYRDGVYIPLLEHIRTYAALAVQRGELCDDRLVRLPQLLVAPLWVGMIHNGVLDTEHPIDTGALFNAQLDLLMPVMSER
ncbi:AcrR family transcriptional regulator [Sphingomonas sp. BE270]|jgi:AcrR family transcriptional regulator|uniref:TetR/AcrR family transcriptional regulator n=2 Tax=Bacteria TaxID=2 RepID=UPI00285950C4|nr:TetR/AcrR family transcriptional regulator [Sphingomonas sp. BE270]MDR7260087.1 AcrR family transcriptional regulator [Sphingomonas sp. BE270]